MLRSSRAAWISASCSGVTAMNDPSITGGRALYYKRRLAGYGDKRCVE